MSTHTTTYTVQPGDSLERISRRLGVTLEELAAQNTLRPGGLIHPGETLKLPGLAPALAIDRSRRLPGDQYIGEKTPKDLIVLHFTAGGTLDGALQSWLNSRERVATAYLVDPAGRIYEAFDPDYWACHLGIPFPNNPAYRMDKRSIGIEIVNWGGLKAVGDQLNCWPGNYGTRYCALEETTRYVKQSFRGVDYFAAFPDAQQEAVCRLTRQLCDRFGIEKHVPDQGQRELLNWRYYDKYKGVASHQNFHAEKTDIGPAFDWERLQKALDA